MSALSHPEICLVSMPWAAVARPSIALSLLKAVLEREGIPARVLYPAIWFFDRIGAAEYQHVSARMEVEFQVGEWIFAEAAFREQAPPEGQLLERVAAHRHVFASWQGEGGEDLGGLLRRLRREATAFIEEAARRILDTRPRVVGCTSTFEQHVASLALLRRIRELAPEVVTLLGGANCEAEMGRATHRCFPWVDYVFSGEADGCLASLCRDILSQGRDLPAEALPEGVLGPCHREAARLDPAAPAPPRRLFRNLDDQPHPDFEDYFEALEQAALGSRVEPGLPLETSRGCWWGAVHHCTFCGLNGSQMSFRSKSPGRVLEEIRALEARYQIRRFETVDNILDMKYFQTVLPALAAEGSSRSIFYEVKSNLSREQVGKLKAAGITWLQPGIESLHSRVLALMNKGVQGYQNVQLLRFAREAGVRLTWSVLHGFPGQEDGWFGEMADMAPLLEHLQAPSGFVYLRFDRFSVYHNRAAELGLKLRPVPAMEAVYPLGREELRELAYFFIEEGKDDIRYNPLKYDGPETARLRRALARWREAFYVPLPPVLSARDDGETLDLIDTRRCAVQPRLRLAGLERAICMLADRAPIEESLPRLLEEQGQAADPEALAAALARLRAMKLVLSMDRRLLFLGLWGDIPSLPGPFDFPGGHLRPPGQIDPPAWVGWRQRAPAPVGSAP